MSIILSYKSILPKIHESVFVAPNAAVIGDTEIGAESSVWFSVTIRGDVNKIRIGKRTNIQDGAVIHVETDGHATHIGDNVTIGHSAIVHACTIEDLALVGMQACVLDGAVVESKALVAAGSLVGPGKVIPSGQLWAGVPARYVRDLTDKELAFFEISAERYVKLSREYL